jgi:hypothetical protein
MEEAPMKRGDELDRKHAGLFAWRLFKPGETVDFPAEGTSAAAPVGSAHPGVHAPASEDMGIPVNADVDIDEALEKARPECAAIEREVAQAWTLSGDAQLRATRGILQRVAKVGVALIGLGKLPSIRLARLVTRHYRRLSPTQRSDCGYIFGLDLSHAESVELVVEAAHSHDDVVHLMSAGDDRSERPSWASPVCAARLASLVDGNAKVRLAALELVSHCALADASPVLRRAIERPEWPVRARAAKLLLTIGELGADECILLLEAATRPLPKRFTQTLSDALELCADTLREALPRLHPPGGDELLLRILDDDRLKHVLWLGGPWALETLAATYPARALGPVDRRMRSDLAMDRMLAVTAVGSLPLAEAEPRLQRAASDPSAAVADWARTTYFRRFGTRCPSPPLGGVATELLEGPPSDRFVSRVGVLRVVTPTTRSAWASTLLAEAPDPEALALLVFLLGVEGATALPGRSLPADANGWATTLLSRFGASQGLAGIFALAARFPFSHTTGWLSALAERLVDGSVPPTEWPRVRAFVEGLIARRSEAPIPEEDAHRLLELAKRSP